MARALPDLATKFATETQKSLNVAAATEALWRTAPPTSDVRRQLKVGQLEALYEAVYLRIFASWENTLEDLVVYFLAGYRSPSYVPAYVGPRPGATLTAARAFLYAGRPFMLWHSAQKATSQAAQHLVACPVESVASAAAAEIDQFAAIRHAIAHASPDARAKFVAATRAIAGLEYKNVGRFLRSDNLTDPLNPTKRVLIVRNRLVDLVALMTL